MNDIESLFKHGVVNVVIGKKENSFFMQAKQGIATGTAGHFAAVEHQTNDENLDTCIEKITRQVIDAESALHKETWIVIPKNNN